MRREFYTLPSAPTARPWRPALVTRISSSGSCLRSALALRAALVRGRASLGRGIKWPSRWLFGRLGLGSREGVQSEMKGEKGDLSWRWMDGFGGEGLFKRLATNHRVSIITVDNFKALRISLIHTYTKSGRLFTLSLSFALVLVFFFFSLLHTCHASYTATKYSILRANLERNYLQSNFYPFTYFPLIHSRWDESVSLGLDGTCIFRCFFSP